ncbi:hypothetical protein K8R43_06605 [archaeon]|nr:hypothetical protein [archaeon]
MPVRKHLNKREKVVLSKCEFNKKTREHVIPEFLTLETRFNTKAIADHLDSIELKGHAKFRPISDVIKQRILKLASKEGEFLKVDARLHRRSKVDAVFFERAVREMEREGVSILRVSEKKHRQKLALDKLRDKLPVIHIGEESEEQRVERELVLSEDLELKKDVEKVRMYLLNSSSKKSSENLHDLTILLRHTNKKDVRRIVSKYKSKIEKS